MHRIFLRKTISLLKLIMNKDFLLSLKVLISNRYLILHAAVNHNKPNFGDALNYYLLPKLTNKRIVPANKIFNFFNKPTYAFVGSVLDDLKYKNVYILGSGFMYRASNFYSKNPKVFFVRGPQTLLKLKEFNPLITNIPFGDASLLIKQFYNPKVKKSFTVGLIPHYADIESPAFRDFFSSLKLKTKVSLIDVSYEIEKFVRLIKACDFIVSSSLHGIIMADLYKIPSIWAEFSDNVAGEGFKFFDYFESTGDYLTRPLNLKMYRSEIDINFIKEHSKLRNVKVLIENIKQTLPKL